MNDIINHKTGNTIWYHTTTKDRVPSILKTGLKINSKPTWQINPEPWIYVSTIPWNCTGNATFEVDLSFLDINDCGWAFADADSPPNEKWQLRVFKDIPVKYIKIHWR
jgi:hypothetical protein